MNAILKKQLARKSGKGGGFTLVEVIVVIVIIAILAAIGVPALTGYIDKAREREVVANAHILHVALQTIGATAYSEGVTGTAFTGKTFTGASVGDGTGEDTNDGDLKITAAATTDPANNKNTIAAEIYQLSGKNFTGRMIQGIKYTANGAISEFTYNEGTDGNKITYAGGKYGDVEKGTA
jgi:prepilin-type N-terminal cleavage/methylation domain-containing protein